MERLPSELRRHVDAFSTGWVATPSASALQAAFRETPWLPEMLNLVEEKRVSTTSQLILRRHYIGESWCRKCDVCVVALLHEIRMRHEWGLGCTE